MSVAVPDPPADTLEQQLSDLIERQQAHFVAGKTRSLSRRLHLLRSLRKAIKAQETSLETALHADLRKPAFESYATEIGFCLEELNFMIKNLRNWAKPESVPTPVTQAISTAKTYKEPYGRVLIISPWNYPFQLAIAPLMGAIAAGNTAVIKPSEFAPNTSAALRELIGEVFDPTDVAVIEGGVETNQALLAQRWDYIFFTGSTRVGRIVMQEAAKHLTPVTLELGGKSPCIVDKDIHLRNTARRIIWGKFINAGQTCVAPDYLLVHREVKDQLLPRLKETITEFFGEDPQQSPDFARIINDSHFQRLEEQLKEGDIYAGGQSDPSDRYIAPTILLQPEAGSKVMEDEIFGPILPVLTYDNLEEAIAVVNNKPRPLSLYVFTNRTHVEQRVLQQTQAGGGCVNDTLVHLSAPDLPFGGIGASGMGAYHGKDSFETFSHRRGVLKKSNLIDPNIRYAPYKNKLGLLRRLMG